jgi:non-specific serine/threonine protein kinase
LRASDPAAGIVEALLRASPGASLLATSREPLRASGEYIYRVPPLAVPAEDNQDAEDVLRHGAVRLFVACAGAAEPQYAPHHRLAATAAICRRLDGIPLAIELAAAHIDGLGVEGVAAHLGDRFTLLTGGNRTALPRHQTMHATLAWSHELLSEIERVVFRRLAVFAGVHAGGGPRGGGRRRHRGQDVVDGVASLVANRFCPPTSPARSSLSLAGDHAGVRAREARGERRTRTACATPCPLFATCSHVPSRVRDAAAAEWLAAYRSQIDNVRVALLKGLSPPAMPRLAWRSPRRPCPLMHLA